MFPTLKLRSLLKHYGFSLLSFLEREKSFLVSSIVKRGFQIIMFAGRICKVKSTHPGAYEVEMSFDFFKKFLFSQICTVYNRSEKFISRAVLVRNLMFVTVGGFPSTLYFSCQFDVDFPCCFFRLGIFLVLNRDMEHQVVLISHSGMALSPQWPSSASFNAHWYESCQRNFSYECN